ncbi:uncharacterized protein LOC111905620 [Lactuca sativa]|uniref:uncharacterized protein LOC111905620 n=1 Tax=Lactuca sativa TaxID=4236 RepID=UPI0022AEF6BA|nr:uncharacterized protein LOC111905620 [Lactuca sativa]
MANFNMNTMTLYSHLLGSSTKILVLIPEYYDQYTDRMEDYLNGLDEELWKCINGTVRPPLNIQNIGSTGTTATVEEQQTRLEKHEKRCMRELRGALPPAVYNYIRGCKTAKEIWNTLKEKYQGSEKIKINSMKQCLVELKGFRQKEIETIEFYYDRLNELIYRCNRYGITRSLMEYNLTFVMGFRKEWRSLKTHESKVSKIDEESKMSLGEPLALVSKVSEVESAEKENSDEEGLLLNSDDKAITFYSNNQVKKFFKKPFNPKGKKSEHKGSFMKSVEEEKKKFKKSEEKDQKMKEFKGEKKLKGDSGIDYHYCNGSNNFIVGCMLRNKEEKKNKNKDEAYYMEKLEEVREKAKGVSLVARRESEDEESGTYQIWSSSSDDEERRKVAYYIVAYFDVTVVSASNEAKKLNNQLLET